MNIDIDLGKLDDTNYDDRWLQKCDCGQHWYPSKMMFLMFLEQYKDVIADVSIHSVNDSVKESVRISVELEYPLDPNGYMNYFGRISGSVYGKQPHSLETDMKIIARSFDEAIQLIADKTTHLPEGHEALIRHHNIWQPIRWYMEDEE